MVTKEEFELNPNSPAPFFPPPPTRAVLHIPFSATLVLLLLPPQVFISYRIPIKYLTSGYDPLTGIESSLFILPPVGFFVFFSFNSFGLQSQCLSWTLSERPRLVGLVIRHTPTPSTLQPVFSYRFKLTLEASDLVNAV